jgi:hypothetical protein
MTKQTFDEAISTYQNTLKAASVNRMMQIAAINERFVAMSTAAFEERANAIARVDAAYDDVKWHARADALMPPT